MAQGLSARRELVEQLDPEPLYDYLIQNGVLEQQVVDQVKQERSPVKTNLALLQKVEEQGKPAEGLLLIALRQTGQHYLANLLDDSDRIKALSGSGYLSKSRHKGQLSLKVVVRAIKLPTDCYKSSTGALLHTREWLSLEDFTNRNLTNGQSSTNTSIPQLEVAEDEPTKQSNCLCGCFSKLFSKHKNKKLDDKKANSSNGKSKASKYLETGEAQPSGEPTTPIRRANSERLMNLENLFRQKVSEFCGLFEDDTGDAHTLLLKYFEQEKGLLVLDMAADCESISVVNICTTLHQLRELIHDYHSGKLTSDLEKWVITDNILQSVGAIGLKIGLECEQDELDLVEHELS